MRTERAPLVRSRYCKAIVFAAATLTVFCGCARKPASFHATAYEPSEKAPTVELTRGDSSAFTLASQRGSVVLIFFGYTHCPDVCPTTLSDWRRIKRALGPDASRVRFVFVSVDPVRDTPAGVQKYVAGFDSTFIGVTGDSARLSGIEQAFHITSGREESGSANGYGVVHASQTFVIDQHGELRLLYSFGMGPEDVTADVRQLLAGA